MINYSDKTVVIPKGYHIGNIEKVKEIFNVDTSKKNKEFRGEMKVNEKEKTEKERLEILLKNTTEQYRNLLLPIFQKYINIFRRKHEKPTTYN